MHSSIDFEKNNISGELMDLFDDWDYEMDTNKKDMISIIKQMREKIDEEKIFEPSYKLTRTIYDDDSGKVISVKVTVALIRSDKRLKIDKYRKKTFLISAGADFFDDYKYGLMLQENLEEFNKMIEDIIDRDSREFDSARLKRIGMLTELFNEEDRFKDLYTNRKDVYSHLKIISLLVDCMKEYEHIKRNKEPQISEIDEGISTMVINKVFDNKMYDGFSNYEANLSAKDSMTIFGEVVDDIISIIDDIQPNKDRLNISFAYGKGLLDISDNYAVLGLSEDVIKKLGTLPLFGEHNIERSQGYKDIILQSIKQCRKSYDLVNIKSIFTKDVEIHDGKSLHNIIMKSFRKLKSSGKGVGYYMNKGTIALIEKKKATDSEIEKGNYFTSVKGEKLSVKFKVKPFDIKTKKQKQLTIEDIWSEIQKTNE